MRRGDPGRHQAAQGRPRREPAGEARPGGEAKAAGIARVRHFASAAEPPPWAAALDRYLSAVVDRLTGALGPDLAGAWITGSAALGDFDSARSDLDVQAVSEVEVPRPTLGSLAGELSEANLPCPARALELVVYTRAGLPDPRGPAFALNLNTGPGAEHHAGFDPEAEPRFWFTIDVSIARQRGHAIAGRPPAELLPALPRQLVIAALRDSLAWHRPRDSAAAVLAACRGWAWASEGRWLSKAEAARWAAARLDDPEPVDRALSQRRGAGPGPAPADVVALLDDVDRRLGMLP